MHQSCVSYSIVILCSELLLHTIEEVREEIQEVTVLLASLRLKRLARTAAAAAAAAASLDWIYTLKPFLGGRDVFMRLW